MSIELSRNEEMFLRLVRGFDFLHKLGYFGAGFGVYGPEPGFVMKSLRCPRSVSVNFAGALHVAISRRPRFFEFASERSLSFSLHQIYADFGSEDLSRHPQAIEKNAAFMQEHLLPVLDGRMWIDDLLGRSPKRGPVEAT